MPLTREEERHLLDELQRDGQHLRAGTCIPSVYGFTRRRIGVCDNGRGLGARCIVEGQKGLKRQNTAYSRIAQFEAIFAAYSNG